MVDCGYTCHVKCKHKVLPECPKAKDGVKREKTAYDLFVPDGKLSILKFVEVYLDISINWVTGPYCNPHVGSISERRSIHI